jgi:hypothetical protein
MWAATKCVGWHVGVRCRRRPMRMPTGGPGAILRPVVQGRRFAMKFGVILGLVVVLAGCSSERLPQPPTAPTPSVAPAPPPPPPPPPTPTTGTALLWAMVIVASGPCIEGATIQIVGPQGAGKAIPQQTPCDAWADDGGVLLQNLPAGIEVTLRGAAPGYVAREMRFLPSSPDSYQAVFITLEKAQ